MPDKEIKTKTPKSKDEYWLVTPPNGGNRKFSNTEEMVAFLRDNPASMVSWCVRPRIAPENP